MNSASPSRSRGARLKATAAFAAFVFFFNTVVPSAPAQVMQGGTLPASVPASSSSWLGQFEIPESLGRVESVFVNPDASPEVPAVIHIQDAHTHAEAQLHIEGILEDLQSRGLISKVFVEGAAGPLHPEILKVTGRDPVNLALADYLLNLGELTGVERFALKSSSRLPVLGAEDPSLYRESYAVFTRAKELQGKTLPALESYAQQIEKLQMSVLPKDVHEYVMRSSEWHRHQEASFRYFDLLARYSVRFLGLDFSDARLQFEWPSFVRLMALQKIEEELNSEASARDLDAVLKALESHAAARGGAEERVEFLIQQTRKVFSSEGPQTWVPDERHSEIKSIRDLMEALRREVLKAEIDLLAYPDFLRKAGALVLREEVDARLLFSEIDRIEKQLEDAIAVTPQQKEVLSLTRDFRILEKLFALNVSREEFDSFLAGRSRFEPAAFRERVVSLSSSREKAVLGTLSKEHLELAVRFYELARKRDQVLLDRTLEGADGKAVVLITGGFHSQGVTELLRERGVSHAVVAPKMTQPGDETLYEKVMLGKHVSETVSAPSAAALVKMMLLQLPQTYSRLNPGSEEEQSGLVFRGLRDAVLPALRAQGVSEQTIFEELSRWIGQTGVFEGSMFSVTYDSAARQVVLSVQPEASAASRSELRMAPEPDTLAWIAENLPEDADRQKVIDAITALNVAAQERYDAAGAGMSRTEYLLSRMAEAQSLYDGLNRNVSLQEVLIQEKIASFKIYELSLAHRAAFILGAFNETDFPVIHDALRNAFGAIRFDEHRYSEDLSAEEYARLARRFSEAVSRETVQENLIIRQAITGIVFKTPASVRRALEKENLVNELMRELKEPGKGRIPKLVFLTDLHGSTKVGSFIALALGIDDYAGITSPAQLEQRLLEDWKKKNPTASPKNLKEILEERNVLIVGGSDYVDRGPKPYWGFQFNKWLRDNGLLKFINGNHDLWKDWNVIGLHLRVHDTLREIAASGRTSGEDLAENLSRIRRYVTTVGWDREKDRQKFEDTEAQITAVMRSFMTAMVQGSITDAVIETTADQIIDSGNNANHSLEWWAREWGIHGGWFDTFLDQINEELVNEAVQDANRAITSTPNASSRLLAILQDETVLPEAIRPYAALWREKLQAGKPMFDRVEASLFSKGDDVKALKTEIERIKKANAEIRSANEKLAAEKRFGEMTPQHKVPSAFELTAKAAQQEMARLRAASEALNDLLPGLNLPVPSAEVVTQQNYRTNPSVVETALWDWKNFRLLYTDVYDNIYVHGIIPVDTEKLDFKVSYTNPEGQTFRGIAAIERIQYEVRSFFEKYDTLPDTPEFRAELDQRLGAAFQVLNEWYSDVLGFLKPESIQGFLKSGGAKKYPFGQSSDFSPREFNGEQGTMHVGHVESAKLRKQKMSYWIGGMEGGLLHGDFEMSEGYSGLGAIVQWFSRNQEGKLRGFSRYGYRESVPFYNNQIKEKEKKFKEASAATEKARTEQKSETEIEPLAAAEAKLKKDIEDLKARRESLVAAGERMEDITFHDDLMAPDAEKIRPFVEGGDLARYYIDRFLRENREAYRVLKEQASEERFMERASFYERRQREMSERLRTFRKEESNRLLDELLDLNASASQKIAEIRGDIRSENYAAAAAKAGELTGFAAGNDNFAGILAQTSRALELFSRSELRGESYELPEVDPVIFAGNPFSLMGAAFVWKFTAERVNRSELRSVDLTMEQFLEEFPAQVLEIWKRKAEVGKPMVVAFSGAEADGKSTAAYEVARRIEELRAENKESYPLQDNSNISRVISLDRWFLERHRRAVKGNERAQFLGKWSLTPSSDVLYGDVTPVNIQDALRALREGKDVFAPMFLNSLKQRIRITDSAPYADPVSQNIRPSQVRPFHERISDDIQFLLRFKKTEALTVDLEGRQLVRLFSTGHHWNFNEPEEESDKARMREIETRLFSGLKSFWMESGSRIDHSNYYLDTKTGDILEKISPSTNLLLIEGVLSLLPETTGGAPQTLFDETVWVSAGMPETLEEALQDSETNVRLWRYVYRRLKEGRLNGVSIPQLVNEFRQRQSKELPIIFSQRPFNHYRVNSLSENERRRIERVDEVVPVIIAFDVGGGAVSMAHEVMQRGEDGFSFVFSGKLEKPYSEPTRSREGPSGEGRDKVLAQIAILAIERILDLQAEYPGRPIMPVLAIGAPGNTAHPSYGESIAPRSADNLGSDFDGVVPDVELRELIRLFSGLNLQIVWKNDSLAQAYAAVSELLPNHPEYKNDTVLFLSLGTGLGMGIVRLNSNGDAFETIGDSHNFDLDFTDQFPIVKHPVYGESFKVMTPGGEVFVPTSEKGKVRAEDLVSGRAIRQILSAFERQALDREQQFGRAALSTQERPFFLKAAGQIYQLTSPQRSDRVRLIESNNIEIPVHKQLVLDGFEAIHPHDRDKLRQVIQHEYTKTPVNGWLLNKLAENQHGPFVEYSDQIEAWIEWVAEFLASRTLDVIKRTRSGDMRKTNDKVSWPEEWEQQLRNLNLRHVVVGSGVATEGQLAAVFRSKLKNKLQNEFPDEDMTLNVVPSMPKMAGVKGARLYVNANDAQKEIALHLAENTSVYLDPPPFYKNSVVDRDHQKSLALERPRVGVLLDLGDALLSKDKPLPKETKRILNALVNKGIPVGVATGKPIEEVYALFEEDPDDNRLRFADKLYIYALNGSVIHAPMKMRSVYPGEIDFFEESTKVFIEEYLFPTLAPYGFGPAFVYPDKNDLTKPSGERRSFEGPGPTGSRINVTAILGDRNPNFHRITTASIINHLAETNGHQNLLSADVAGRIGLDLSHTNKGTAEAHFSNWITDLIMPVALERVSVENRRLGIKRGLGLGLDRGDILKIFDLYQNGLGMDAQMADPYSYSVGTADLASPHDIRAPVMIGGGPDQTPLILSQTRFVDEAGQVFRVGFDGTVKYEAQPEVSAAFIQEAFSNDQKEEYGYWIQQVLSGLYGTNEEGQLFPLPSIASSLTGWARLPARSSQRNRAVMSFVQEVKPQFDRVVVIAMGGPGNAANLMLNYHNKTDVILIDHLDPANLAKVSGSLSRTLFVVSSKSGTTTEILAMMDFYRQRIIQQGLRPEDHFVIITDKASPMNRPGLARRVFINDSDAATVGDIGGRFSIGSYFGFLPAALGGVNIETVSRSMNETQKRYQESVDASSLMGVQLAEVLYQAREQGRNKVTLVFPPALESFSLWLKQLFNESLGKTDNPIMVVSGESYSINPDVYGKDRIFLRLHFGERETFEVRNEHGLPVIDIRAPGVDSLGGLLYHMMMAVTLTGFRMGVNPFDQPAVEQSKKNTRELVEDYLRNSGPVQFQRVPDGNTVWYQGKVSVIAPEGQPSLPDNPDFLTEEAIADFLGKITEGQYFGLLATTYESEGFQASLKSIRTMVRDRLKTHPATIVGTVSKDNHSNLQLHAAEGNKEPAVIIFTFDSEKEKEDPVLSQSALEAIGFQGEPSRTLSYSQLNRLIAQGEYKALAEAGKKVMLIHLPAQYRTDESALHNLFEKALLSLENQGKALPARSELRTEDNEDIWGRWLQATQKIYRAEISDVDGNLTPTWGSEVPDEVVRIFQDNLRAGIPQGIASVRSEEGAVGLREIENRILAGLDPDAVSKYIFFSENGTFAHWQEWDASAGAFVRRSMDIAQLFKKVPEGYVLTEEERRAVYASVEDFLSRRFGDKVTDYKESKTYGFLASVIRNNEWSDREYSDRVAKATSEVIDFLAGSEDPVLSGYDAMMTRTSIVIMKKGVNKSLAIQFFSDRYNLNLDEVVGTDDQASREGNGWFLTQHSAGFSTNESNLQGAFQIPLKEIFGVTGVDAWLRMHEFLKFKSPEERSVSTLQEQQTEPIRAPFRQGNVQIETKLEQGKSLLYSRPIEAVDIRDGWQVQRYFRDLYDSISDFSQTIDFQGRQPRGFEVQLNDEVLNSLIQWGLYRDALNRALGPKLTASAFVNQLDLYRLLAVLREKRFVAPVPSYAVPVSREPVRTALVVNPDKTNLDAILLREWLGNPEVSFSVIVGTTPGNLASRLHSSVYGEYPVSRENIRVNDAEKWIEIMGKRIYVVPAAKDVPDGTQIDLVLSVYPLSDTEKNSLTEILSAGGVRTVFMAAQNLDVFAFNPADKAIFSNQEKAVESSLLSVPAEVADALKKTPLSSVPHSVGLDYSISPTVSQPILDRSGVDRSALKNVVPAGRPVQDYIRESLRGRFGPGLGEVSIQSVPVPVGDMVYYRITVLPGDYPLLLSSLGLQPSDVSDEQNLESVIREAFVETVLKQAKTPLIDVETFRPQVATDARFERKIMLGEAGIEVSASATAAGPMVQIVVPVLFNRELQDIRLLSEATADVSRALKGDFKGDDIDARLSEYGRAVDFAIKRGTFAPVPLEIPEKIGRLLEKPVVVGVLGPQGQIGSRLGILGFQSLNYVVAYGSVDRADKVHDAAAMSSITGPIRFNGQTIPVISEDRKVVLRPDQGRTISGIVGYVRFGDGDLFYLLPRYKNPKDIPWGSFGVEVVVDATGAFLKTEQLLGHLNSGRTTGDGAQAVLLTAPFKENPNKYPTIVYGVNHDQIRDHFEKGKPPVFSNASCTTNCMALMTQYINRLPGAFSRHLKETYGVQAAVSDVVLSPSLTVHSPTNSNPLADASDRSAAGTIFYKSGVTKAINELGLPDDPWPQAFTGFAFRVGGAATSISHLPVVFQIENMSESDRLVLEASSKKISKELLAVAERVAIEMSAEKPYQGLFRSVATTEQWTSEIAAGTRAVIVDWQQAQVRFRPEKQLLGISLNGFYDNVEQYTAQLARTLDEVAVELREFESVPRPDVPGDSGRAELRSLDLALQELEELGVAPTADEKARILTVEDAARYADRAVRVNYQGLDLASLKVRAEELIRAGQTSYQGPDAISEALRDLRNIRGIEAPAFLNHIANLVADRIRSLDGSPRSELRLAGSETFESWKADYQAALPFLGSRYEDRRWVAVHMTRGIFAVIPSTLASVIRDAARRFVQRDLFYFDGNFARPLNQIASPSETQTALNQPGLEISIAEKIENPDAHFLGVGELLSRKPNAYIYEVLVGASSEDAQKLQRMFSEDPAYSAFSERYRVVAASKKDLSRKLQDAAAAVYNRVRGASDAANLAEFIERHVAFSSTDRETLVSGLTHSGWLIHDDLGRHPGLVAARMDRSVALASGQLEPELIRKLGEIKSLRQVISAAGSLMAGMNLQLIEDLWNKEMAQRWFYKSA